MSIGRTAFGKIILENEMLEKIEDEILVTISRELPKEAQVYEVLSYIFKKTEEHLRYKMLIL